MFQNSTVKKEIQREIRKYFELNENKTYHMKTCVLSLEQYLGNIYKFVPIVLNIRKEERSQNNKFHSTLRNQGIRANKIKLCNNNNNNKMS